MKKIIIVIFGFLFVNSQAYSSVFEPKPTFLRAYVDSMGILSGLHFSGENVDKETFKRGLKAYMESLDKNKIIFSEIDLNKYLEHLPQENLDVNEELALIYQIYNDYLSKLDDLRQNLQTSKPRAAVNKYLPTKMAKTAANLEDYRNDFVFDRYLRATMNQVDETSVGPSILALIEAYKKVAVSSPDTYPLKLFLQEMAQQLDSFTYFKEEELAPPSDDGLLGFHFSNHPEGLVVDQVIPGFPAEAAGLKAKDIIVGYQYNKNSPRISMSLLILDEALAVLSGKAGTTSTLFVSRNGQKFAFSITRKSLAEVAGLESVIELEELNDQEQSASSNITIDPHVNISFIKNTDSQKRTAVIHLKTFMASYGIADLVIAPKFLKAVRTIEELWNQDPNIEKSFVIDMRDNPGGDLDEVMAIAQMFAAEPLLLPIVDNERRLSGKQGEMTYANQIPNVPIAVWVNQHCASACEVLSSVLQDLGRAIIVGSKTTFGKGIGQRALPIFQGSESGFDNLIEVPNQLGRLAVTQFVYFRISGKAVQNIGVKSDISFDTGLEYFGQNSMNSLDNPMMIEGSVPLANTLVNPIDPKLIEQLQERSRERWKTSPYRKLTQMFHLYYYRASLQINRSLNLKERLENKAELTALAEGLDKALAELEGLSYQYQLESYDGKAIESKRSTAASQEYIQSSMDYFSSI